MSGPSLETITHRGGSAADYDGDGDLDLFLAGPNADSRLYRNDTVNGNRWLEVACVGTQSNRAAIGARVEVHAVIGGAARWQMREVSAQNTFNGHSMLLTHFGLGDAVLVESVVVHWPSGTVDTVTNLAVNQKLTVTESEPVVSVEPSANAMASRWLTLAPNPFRERADLAFTTPSAGRVRLDVFDVAGRIVATPVDRALPPGRHHVALDGRDLAPGLYLVRVRTASEVRTARLVRLR